MNVVRARTRTWQRVALLVAIGFALRLFLLGSKSLWLDEVNGLQVAAKGQAALWAGQSEAYHPPLYYWILEKWQIFGRSESALRMSSAIFGTLSIWIGYALGKVWFGRKVGLTAAALLTFSPLLIWYAQELRPYAIMSFLGLLIILSASKLFIDMNWPYVAAYTATLAASMAMMFYLHYFAVLFIPLQLLLFVVLLAAQRTSWLRLVIWLGAMGLSIAAYLPWIQTPNVSRFLSIVLSENNYITLLLNERLGTDLRMTPTLVIILLIVGLGIGLPFCYAISRWLFTRPNLADLRRNSIVQGIVVTLFVTSLVIFLIPRGYSLKRHTVAFFPLALVAVAWFWPWKARIGRILPTILFLSLFVSFFNTLFIPKPQWEKANGLITTSQQTGDLVLLEPGYMTIPFNFYNHDSSEQLGVPFASSELETALQKHERIWFVTHGSDYDRANQNGEWLAKNAQVVDEYQFYRVKVQLFEANREVRE